MKSSLSTPAAVEHYEIDVTHSTLEFSIAHLGFARVKGRFTSFGGSIEIPSGANVPSHVSVHIDVASVDTGVKDRDEHLRSNEFLATSQFPESVFHSTKISGVAEAFVVNGELNLRGVERVAALRCRYKGRMVDPYGKCRVAFYATCEIDRTGFGILWNQTLDAGGLVVGKTVEIEIDVQAIKSDL